MKRKIKKRTVLICIFAAVILLIAAECFRSSHCMKVTEYNLTTEKLDTGVRFAVISDLHNKKFGKGNENLVEAIEELDPDFVCVVGDMVTKTVEDDSVAVSLLERLTKYTSVFYCLGNHETALMSSIDINSDIEGTGAILLDNDMVQVQINGEEITIGGLSDFPYYEFYPKDYQSEEAAFLERFLAQQGERYSILLTHQPEYFSDILNGNDIDLMISGHTHGGLVRLPFIGGLYAPNQGWFPKYDKGLYTLNNSTLIVTSGLGNSNPLPRFNNPPEICLINITKS